MKKTIIFLLIMLLSTALIAQSSMINLRVGDSEAKGILGAEIAVSHFSLSAGWRPGRVSAEQKINSWDFGFTVYAKQWHETGFYASIAYATEGCAYKKSPYNILYTVEPAGFIMIGFRINANDVSRKFTDRILIDAGLGYKRSNYYGMPTFEVGVSYSLFKYRKSRI